MKNRRTLKLTVFLLLACVAASEFGPAIEKAHAHEISHPANAANSEEEWSDWVTVVGTDAEGIDMRSRKYAGGWEFEFQNRYSKIAEFDVYIYHISGYSGERQTHKGHVFILAGKRAGEYLPWGNGGRRPDVELKSFKLR